MATKIRVTKNDPPTKAVVSDQIIATKTKDNDRLDVRDILSQMAGSGNTDLTNEDVRANYLRLKGVLGEKAAQKIVNHVGLFNQRPETLRLTPEQRVQSLYSMGSADPEVADILKQGKTFGYGVIDGFRKSPLIGNMALTGRPVPPAVKPTAAAEKIKLIVKNTTK